MTTYEKINELCKTLGNCENPLEEGQTVVILGIDTNKRENFNFADGNVIDVIACLGMAIDIFSHKQNVFTKQEIINIINYDGGDEEIE